MPAALRDRPGVPLCQIGTWMTMLGEWHITPDMLRDAVVAQHDPSFRTPVIKLGHVDSRFTDGQVLGDGQPAVGRVERLRLSADGSQLLGDLVGIPAWLDDVLDTAYPSRSIEANTSVETTAGAKYAMVVTGLALLGEATPAIETLGDLADLFGVTRDVESYVAASRVVASALPQEEPMPPVRALGQVVAAGASIDELMRAAEEWAEDQPMLGDCWVRDIGTDWVVFTVWLPGGDTRLYRCSWNETNGAFAFGTPERVRPTYEPVPEPAGGSGEAAAAAAMPAIHYDVRVSASRHAGHAVPSGRGRDVTAGSAHPSGVTVPISPALAAELGVPEDADDAVVLEAIAQIRSSAAPAPPEPQQQTSQEGGTTETAPAAPDVEALVAAAVKRATEPILASLSTTSSELANIKAERAEATKKGVLDGAVTAGKIAPVDRDAWAKRYDEHPGVITEVLASIAPGTAIPITAAGHTSGEADSLTAEDEALWRQLFPQGSDA